MSYPPYMRGPAPANVVPIRPTVPAAVFICPDIGYSFEAEAEAATTWKTLPSGRRVVVNPAACMFCHAGPHPATAHHDFTPDELDPVIAAAIGWRIPEEPA